MGHSRVRVPIVAALLLAAFGTFGTTSATAAPVSKAAAAAPTENRDTAIVAGKKNLLGMNLKPTARLTDAATGDPLVGFTVSFYYLNQVLPPFCSAVTNAVGVATCGGVREQIGVIQNRGYDAQFQSKQVGDVYYSWSTDEVGLFGS